MQIIITGYCSEADIPIYNGKFKNIDNSTNKINQLIAEKKIDFAFIRIVNRKNIVKLESFFVKSKEGSKDDIQEDNDKGKATEKVKKEKRIAKEEENPFRQYFDEIESESSI